MKQHISALMDGELFDDEADELFDQMKVNPDAREEWRIYHLISDALNQPGRLRNDMSHTMRERLQAEPTVLAPRRTSSQKAKWFALSAAASVMAITLVAWLSMEIGSDSMPQMATMQPLSAIQTASLNINTNLPISSGLNDYLIAHQEFSPNINMQGTAPYILTAARQ